MSASHAIDNPDAPHYVEKFHKKAERYERRLRQYSGTTQSISAIYRDYEEFLDDELNIAYNLLIENLNGVEEQVLRDSQRNWIKYRNTEFKFISTNWTRKNFGSSFVISRGEYRTKILKNRVIVLYHYLKNY